MLLYNAFQKKILMEMTCRHRYIVNANLVQNIFTLFMQLDHNIRI